MLSRGVVRTCAVVFALAVSAGCQDENAGLRRDLNRRQDELLKERKTWEVQQATLQIAILKELNGRPLESLSYEERLKVQPLGNLLVETQRIIKGIDGQIEDVNNQLENLDK